MTDSTFEQSTVDRLLSLESETRRLREMIGEMSGRIAKLGKAPETAVRNADLEVWDFAVACSASVFGVTPAQIKSHRRIEAWAIARHVARYLPHVVYDWPCRRISKAAFTTRSNVQCSISAVRTMRGDKRYKDSIERAVELFRGGAHE